VEAQEWFPDSGSEAAAFDEMTLAGGRPRPLYRRLHRSLERVGRAGLGRRQVLARRAFRDQGVTFTVTRGAGDREKLFPFDPIPRIIDEATWAGVDAGLRQRVRALNHFLDDVYGRQLILRQGRVPADVVLSSTGFRRELMGLVRPDSLRAHVAGIDLVRDVDGTFLVLEDNLRTPSGMSYLLANRRVEKRVFPELFAGYDVRPVEEVGHRLVSLLRGLAAPRVADPTVVVLTPGTFNSAYFEHLYLAKQMGVELVVGSDLIVDDGRVWMRTTTGPRPVHVIYRRMDDEFLDPVHGRADSVIGVPGLIGAHVAGNVILANGLGNGVADDKAVYAFVPEMIRYYLGEEPVLPNVPTYLCQRAGDLDHVLQNLPRLVVKTVAGSGGYGMLIGPASTAAQRDRMARRIRARPRDFIAQPVINLSMQAALVDGRLASRHQDLRPFVLSGPDPWVTPGGLTRVALRAGSLVVNSSQGGGSRDTWVVRGRDAAAQ
jgi:uncharacterized circularly permuted ATP-grasp superfamily protein